MSDEANSGFNVIDEPYNIEAVPSNILFSELYKRGVVIKNFKIVSQTLTFSQLCIGALLCSIIIASIGAVLCSYFNSGSAEAQREVPVSSGRG